VTVYRAPAEPARLDALGARHDVTMVVAPAFVIRVRETAIKLYYDPVLLVVGIPVR
jgi:hypothetical protein